MAIADGSILTAADLNLLPRSFASTAARDAYYTANPGLKVPGIVAVIGTGADYAEYVWTGAAWQFRGPRTMGRSVLAADTPLGTGWTTLLSITPTMVASAALLTCTGWIGNGDSGGQRTALVQLTRDGADFGAPHNFVLPAVAGATVGQPIAITVEIPAETAGAHTYTMKVTPSIASAVVVRSGSRLAVEQGGM